MINPFASSTNPPNAPEEERVFDKGRPGTFAASLSHWDHPRTALGVRIMADHAVEHGYSREAVLASTGLSPEELDSSVTLVDARQEITATRNFLTLMKNRPGLGLEVGRKFHLTTYGQLGFALLSSPRTVDMTHTALRLLGLTFAFSTVTAEITPDGRYATRFSGDGVPEDVRQFLIERDLAATVTTHNELFAGDSTSVPLLSVRSQFAGVAGHPLFDVPVEFGAADTAIVFEREYLTQALPQACAETAQECISLCERILSERLDRRGAAAAVRARLLRLGGRDDGIVGAAQALHMTDRTLRRKLTAEGTSYRRIVDDVRAAVARELLEVDQLTATETAHRLGFGDLSSFLRAQRRWEQTVPGFRRD
ncbi:AraC family transcriptional regulator ligand-binding domain-containing protein [Gordonia sp. KTR9]|uniref:AraC family transcriptional regulator ligand-binding domain-containing protein n=1 Tax=Gordonia sp. KTR9 TaxID=337191 RepID=UPI00027DE6AB|nr:AraC family transcriptional regulator ligand-binding domain-containing protein [Gordonia sp. KTR9]AFR50947.1 transcriptional regulator, AraC family [Gordonia sp. KTR9]